MSEPQELFFDTLLVIHVVAGTAGLTSALLASSNQKGARSHRLIGTAYFWSMLIMGTSVIPVTVVQPDPFLLSIALFSLYMAFAGYRRGRASYRYQPVDRVAAVLMAIVAAMMVGYGGFLVTSGDTLGFALAAFGLLGLGFGIEDSVEARNPLGHVDKVRIHLARMLGGTIAILTAVLVTQGSAFVSEPAAELALWLAPTIFITPLIAAWSIRIKHTRRYRLLPAR